MSERRNTPLAIELVREIAATGPIGIDAFMQRCLTDPKHGYYTTRAGIGREGDFTTAPEISQVFGELIGLWAVVVWQQMGSPDRVNLVELGPGRGTLMADALRAARVLPTFLDAADVHLCEISPAFRKLQAETLKTSGLASTWHDAWPDLAPAPTIVVANEFLDAVPVSQWQCDETGDWQQQCVGVDDAGELTFMRDPERGSATPPTPARELPIVEKDAVFTFADFEPLARDMVGQASRAPLAALFIDYGHTECSWGDTLQAVRRHKFEHPLCSPGEADLSAGVDFAAFRSELTTAGLVSEMTTQAEFLGRLGIAERASKLMAANPDRATELESGVFRLMATPGMGTRFHVLAARSTELPPLPGFGSITE